MGDSITNDQEGPLKTAQVADHVTGESQENIPLRESISNNVKASQLLSSSNAEPLESYPKSRIALMNRFVDEPRPLRVAVIGGGLSGILAGILLPAKVPGIELTIFEKNEDFVSEAVLTSSAESKQSSGRDVA